MSYSQRNACPPKLKGAALAWGYMLLSANRSRAQLFWISVGHVVCCHTECCLLHISGVPQQLLQGRCSQLRLTPARHAL